MAWRPRFDRPDRLERDCRDDGSGRFAVIYSLYGGLKAVALTDIIQVVVLVAGGFAITGIVLSLVGDGAVFLPVSAR